jgi:hypothetical protein
MANYNEKLLDGVANAVSSAAISNINRTSLQRATILTAGTLDSGTANLEISPDGVNWFVAILGFAGFAGTTVLNRHVDVRLTTTGGGGSMAADSWLEMV